MKANRLQSYGDIDQFKVEEVPTPSPGPGEVLIKVAASGLNPVDLYIRQGYTAQVFPMELPAILGLDGAGAVAALGPGVTGLAVGDCVIVHLNPNGKGTHAEFVTAPWAGIAKLSATVSFEEGATLPLVGLTGRQAVDALGVKAGDRVLVSGALGGVGRAAVQYLKELGASPVAAVRRDRLAEGQSVAGEAVDIDLPPTPPGFDCAVSAAAPVAGNVVRFLRDGGKIASVVQTPEDANPGGRVTVIQVMGHDDPVLLQQIANAAGRGELKIPVVKTFPLSDLGAAHKALASNLPGKIVLLH